MTAVLTVCGFSRIVKVAFSVGHMFFVLPAFFLTAHSRCSLSCNVEVIHAVGWMKVSTRLALWLCLFGDKKLVLLENLMMPLFDAKNFIFKKRLGHLLLFVS